MAVHNESVGSFTVDGQYVYWTSQGQIWRLAKVGSPTATPIVTIGHNPQKPRRRFRELLLAGLFPATRRPRRRSAAAARWYSRRTSDRPQWVHLDATNVYWPTDGVTSAIQTVSKSGGTAMSMITTGQPDAIEVDASNVYWISVKLGHGAINRLNKATLSNQVIATMGSAWKALAIDDTHVYAASENTVVRVPKTGGTVETIATNQANVQDLALGVTSVYWTNFVADGTVMRAEDRRWALAPSRSISRWRAGSRRRQHRLLERQRQTSQSTSRRRSGVSGRDRLLGYLSFQAQCPVTDGAALCFRPMTAATLRIPSVSTAPCVQRRWLWGQGSRNCRAVQWVRCAVAGAKAEQEAWAWSSGVHGPAGKGVGVRPEHAARWRERG